MKSLIALSCLGSAFLLSGCFPAVVAGTTAGGVAIAQERSVGGAIDDIAIKTRINSRFLQKDVNDLFSGVDVESTEGRVLLTGKVYRPESKVEASRLAWEVDGVREVINEIQVVDNSTVPNMARDAWITAQIKGRLLAEKGVRSVNYSVETVNGTVYLMGIAQNQLELDKVTTIASRTKYVRQVVSHVRLKDDPLRKQYLGGQ